MDLILYDNVDVYERLFSHCPISVSLLFRDNCGCLLKTITQEVQFSENESNLQLHRNRQIADKLKADFLLKNSCNRYVCTYQTVITKESVVYLRSHSTDHIIHYTHKLFFKKRFI